MEVLQRALLAFLLTASLTGCTVPQMAAIGGLLTMPTPVSPDIVYSASPPLNCDARAEAERRRYEAVIPTRSKTTCNSNGYGKVTCDTETRPNIYAENAYQAELSRCQLGQ